LSSDIEIFLDKKLYIDISPNTKSVGFYPNPNPPPALPMKDKSH